MSTAANQETAPESLSQRTAQVVKEAHELLNESRTELEAATGKIASYEEDKKAATAIRDEAFSRLLEVTHPGGSPLVPPESRDAWKTAIETQRGMADLFTQLVNVVENRQEAESKSAGELGGAADEWDTPSRSNTSTKTAGRVTTARM